MRTNRTTVECERFSYLIRIIDDDLDASEYLPCRRVFIHGDLKHVLWAVLPIEGWRVIVEVHHSDCHRGDDMVLQQSVIWSYLRGLGLQIDTQVDRQIVQRQ